LQGLVFYTSPQCPFQLEDKIFKEYFKKNDKGKLSERIGRKVMGLKHVKCQDCQTAGFFVFPPEF
jgi:hypothetical protein